MLQSCYEQALLLATSTDSDIALARDVHWQIIGRFLLPSFMHLVGACLLAMKPGTSS